MQNAFQHSVRIGLFSLLISVAFGTRAPAIAQSGSAGGSIGNDEKSLSGSRAKPRAVETEKPARRSKPRPSPRSRAAPRERAAAAVAVAAAILTARGLPNPRVAAAARERFTISSGRISGELSSGSVSPNGSHEVRRIRVRFELEQLRPFLGPQRLRNVHAIGRLQRNVDSVETIASRNLEAPAYAKRRSAHDQDHPALPHLHFRDRRRRRVRARQRGRQHRQ